MAIMECTREAICLDCKYYVPAPKPFARIGNINTNNYGTSENV